MVNSDPTASQRATAESTSTSVPPSPTSDDRTEAPSDVQMGLLEHLRTLRGALLRCLTALLVGFALSYPFAEHLFKILVEPLTRYKPDAVRLIYTSPLEVFVGFMKVALVAGLLLAAPFVLYELWCFLAPALRRREKRVVVPLVLVTTLLFFAGVLFGLLVVLPLGYRFFIDYAPSYIHPDIRVSEYLSITTRMLLAFGIMFQLPVIVIVLVRLGLVSTRQILRHWRGVVVSICVLSALLTPADVMTMVLMAGPLLLLFAASVAVARLVENRPTNA